MGWVVVVYLVTSLGVPEALLDAIGIDRGHPVFWQVAHAVFWGSVALVGFHVWKKISDRPRAQRHLLPLVILAGSFQVALFILAGLALGFGRSPYSHDIIPMTANVLYVATILIAVEMSRACIVAFIARRSATLALATATMLFALIGLPLARFTNVNGPDSLLAMVGEHALPSLSSGLLASFLVLVGGPLASIGYLGVLEAFEWLSPILANLDWPVTAFLGTMAPVVGLWIIQQRVGDEIEALGIGGRPAAGREERLGWLGVSVIGVTLLWFVTGMFGVQPVIVSGPSMSPSLDVGDLVVVRNVPPGDVAVGDVIRFRQGQLPVIHRVVMVEDGGAQIVFVTRGDANNVEDEPVLASNVDGKVVLTIPNGGWPSIFLRELVGAAG
ncbi:MAG: signal peptidase I [Acidimicrobiia bacterium]|nr:signal peptidase I [Acidimicrobiia bacterium]